VKPVEMDIDISGHKFQMEFDVARECHRDIFFSIALHSLPYNPDVAQVLLNVLQPGDAFIDIGAHIGWFTLIGARIVGSFGRVLAVSYRCLKRHLVKNDLGESVIPHRMVVSSGNGKVKLYLNQDNDGGHALWPVWKHPSNVISDKNRKTTKVKSTTLDNLCKQEQITKVRLVKIDTEGAEGEILKGAHGLLSEKRIQHIVMEVNDFGLELMGTSIEEITDMMKNYGYGFHQLREPRPGYVYDVLFSLT
jgi:FkbM family methyltransferase